MPRKTATTEETMTETTPFDKPVGTPAKLAEVMRRIGSVGKGGYNQAQNYAYTSAEDVLKKVQAAAADLNLCVQTSATLEKHERFEQNGKSKTHAVVKVTLGFIDGDVAPERGGYPGIQMEAYGEGVDSGDKAIAKANTAALKYALCAGLLIAFASDDPEADTSTDRDAGAVKPRGYTKPAATDDTAAKKVAAAIDSATLETMDDVRKALVGLRGTESYNGLVESIKKKQAELGWKPS